MFDLLFPDRRRVGDKTILTWASDAVANGEVDQAWEADDAAGAALALHEAGIITLAQSTSTLAFTDNLGLPVYRGLDL